jgi:hypothetical protein
MYLTGQLRMKLIEMDEIITFSRQLEEDVGSVIVISKFNIKPDEVGGNVK